MTRGEKAEFLLSLYLLLNFQKDVGGKKKELRGKSQSTKYNWLQSEKTSHNPFLPGFTKIFLFILLTMEEMNRNHENATVAAADCSLGYEGIVQAFIRKKWTWSGELKDA